MSAFVFDERGFGQDSKFVAWDQVQAIGIHTTSGGPYVEDVFWQFLLRDGGWAEVEGSAVGSDFVQLLQEKFPSLDNMKLVEAMGSTTDRTFRLWHAEDSQLRWDERRFRARFVALIDRLGGAAEEAAVTFDRLARAWSEEARRYHNLEHLTECLNELDSVRRPAGAHDIAELALWFHDAVYQPRAKDNEAQSAEWLVRESATLGLPKQAVIDAAECVLATAHLSPSGSFSSDAADLVVDVDLSILGRDVLRFLEFEHSIEDEFAPTSSAFVIRRGCFLSGLLRRTTIFRTVEFQSRYEVKARAQIAALLRSPRYRAFRWVGWMACPRSDVRR